MNLLNNFSKTLDEAKLAFLRFPVTILWAIAGTVFTVWFIESDVEKEFHLSYIKVILTASLGVSWLIAFRLLIEMYKEERSLNRQWLIVIPLLLLGFYYWTLPTIKTEFDDIVTPYRFTLYLVSGHLLVFFTPFLLKWDKSIYWNYLLAIISSFVRSAFFSLVIYFGISIALTSLKYLFEFDLHEKVYLDLYVFCLGVINTWLFLSDLPEDLYSYDHIDYPKVLLVFVKYILIPLTLLYLIILYLYSFKILIIWDLPHGWVSWLVIALSLLGFIIHILINPIRKTTESRLVRAFYPWFYYSLLPMVVLLFVAIFRRISEYGITENRYLVLVLSFWILGMTLYILVSKRKKLLYFPLSVVALSLLMSFGSWGMFSVSINSQLKQFEHMYDELKSVNFKVKEDQKNRFISIINYLGTREVLNELDGILGFDPTIAFKDKSRWVVSNKIIDTLGVEVIDRVEKMKKQGKYNFHSTMKETINVMDYDFMKRMYFNTDRYRTVERVDGFDPTRINQFKFYLQDSLNSVLLIEEDEKQVGRIDLISFFNELSSKNKVNLTWDEMIIEEEFERLNIRLTFHNIEFRKVKDDNDRIELVHANVTVLLKEN